MEEPFQPYVIILFIMYKMQLALVTGPLVPHEICSHG